MTQMQAIVMTAPGGPEVLELQSVPRPELPSPAHIRVRLYAAGVNPVDTKLRAGATYYTEPKSGILGCDGAGVVDAVGDAVTRFKSGDKVYFFQGGIGGEPGCYAEYTTVHADYVAHMPSNLDYVQAAAVPLVLITAWEALRDRVHVQRDDKLLIHAGAGGVGHVAIQLAKLAGTQVATTVGDNAKAQFVHDLGADRIIEYKREDFVEAALAWTDGVGVDVTFDTVGGPTFCRSFAATRVYGKVVTLLQTNCNVDDIKLARLRNQGILYTLMLTPQFLNLHAARIHQREVLEQAARLIEAGDLWVRVSDVLGLSAAAEAHRRLGEGHNIGKIVLRVD